LLSMATAGCVGSLGQKPSAQRHPPKEDTYTITSVLQLLPPVNPADMSDDFQDARVLARDKDSLTVEVTYYPLRQVSIGENPHWRKDYAGMTEYLKPTPTENWDQTMRRDLLAELLGDGIDPDKLTDRQLVEKVSRWAIKRAHSTHAFGIWAVHYPGGKPDVYPPLREAFDREKPEKSWTDQQMFDQEVLGRSMFYNKVHGACTSSSVYLATILRALGIPTRIVVCIPPFDPNDEAQARLFYDQVRHNQVRETIRAALDGTQGFEDHFFNEVYVGHRWVRLNYSTLGQPILDARYFGLLTHIYTCSDLSQMPLAQTWGMRFFKHPVDQPKLSSVNPYRLISVQDHFGSNAPLANPPVPAAELRTVTIIGLYPKGSAAIPKWVTENDAWQRGSTDLLIACREWVAGTYHQMSAFRKRAGHEFLLRAPGQPDLKARLNGLTLSKGDGSFQAYGAQFAPEDRAKLASGVAYSIQPLNVSDTYRWAVAPGTTLLTARPAGPNQVLYDYLGEPVAPPENMDAAYTKAGLTQAMQAAANAAGITLVKLEIEDSEFPFLVGVVCANPQDMEKLKEEILTVPAYNFTGGVGGGQSASYAMNLVHYKAYPAEARQRIQYRLHLREQIFFNKLQGVPSVDTVDPKPYPRS
jgi:Transglutaminase-like superfamily